MFEFAFNFLKQILRGWSDNLLNLNMCDVRWDFKLQTKSQKFKFNDYHDQSVNILFYIWIEFSQLVDYSDEWIEKHLQEVRKVHTTDVSAKKVRESEWVSTVLARYESTALLRPIRVNNLGLFDANNIEA